jgi:hypothetical protein
MSITEPNWSIAVKKIEEKQIQLLNTKFSIAEHHGKVYKCFIAYENHNYPFHEFFYNNYSNYIEYTFRRGREDTIKGPIITTLSDLDQFLKTGINVYLQLSPQPRAALQITELEWKSAMEKIREKQKQLTGTVLLWVEFEGNVYQSLIKYGTLKSYGEYPSHEFIYEKTKKSIQYRYKQSREEVKLEFITCLPELDEFLKNKFETEYLERVQVSGAPRAGLQWTAMERLLDIMGKHIDTN